MFIGAINSQVRKFFAAIAPALDGRTLVIGCSGNFTSETILSRFAPSARLISNDVSLYSCLIGAWLTGSELPLTVTHDDYAFLTPLLETPKTRLAAVMVLLDMLAYHKRNNAHAARMWADYREAFPGLHAKTLEKLDAVQIRCDGYFAGDVLEHFQRFADDPDAIFCCFAPTYAGGYERLYKRLDEVIAWPAPTYPTLTDERRAAMLDFLRPRRYLWYDDRELDGFPAVLKRISGRQRPVYLYTNLPLPATYLAEKALGDLPQWTLASMQTVLTPTDPVRLAPIKTTELAPFKEAFLGKNIRFAAGNWAFAVVVQDTIVGFLEFARDRSFSAGTIYIQADFAIPNTRYARLSKLMVMLARAGETRKALERATELRIARLRTTAFTDRPVSMKYRGIMELTKHGVSPQGEHFLNYEATFTETTWSETYQQWLTKHGSLSSSHN